MSVLSDIEKQLLALPLDQRVSLAESLLGSLPLVGDDQNEIDEMIEVERRQSELKSGLVQPLGEIEFWKKIKASSVK